MVWVGELGRSIERRSKVNPFAEPGRSPSTNIVYRGRSPSGPRGQEPRIVTFDISGNTSGSSGGAQAVQTDKTV